MSHTPGPWRWEINESSKHLSLVGGKPQFDLTIIEPVRWGMGSATLFVRDVAHDGMNILHKLHERRDWVVPFKGREHHANWCAGVKHPDMQVIEAAPDLLEALEAALVAMQNAESIMAAVKVALDRDIPLGDPVHAQSSRLTFPAADLKFAAESARAAIKKARGEA